MTRVPVACVLALLVAGCVSNKIDVVESGVRPDLRARGLAFAPESQGAGPMAKTLQAGGLAVRETPDAFFIGAAVLGTLLIRSITRPVRKVKR